MCQPSIGLDLPISIGRLLRRNSILPSRLPRQCIWHPILDHLRNCQLEFNWNDMHMPLLALHRQQRLTTSPKAYTGTPRVPFQPNSTPRHHPQSATLINEARPSILDLIVQLHNALHTKIHVPTPPVQPHKPIPRHWYTVYSSHLEALIYSPSSHPPPSPDHEPNQLHLL